MWLYDAILASDLPDDPSVARRIDPLFSRALARRGVARADERAPIEA